MTDRVISEGRMVWEVPCEHGKFGHHLLAEKRFDSCEACAREEHGFPGNPHIDCSGGTRHVVDPRRYRTDPVVKRIIDRANALALDGETPDG